MVERWLVLLVLVFATWRSAGADDARGVRLGEETVSRWRFGVVVKATGAVSGIKASMVVPQDWPEQTVKQLEPAKSPKVGAISFRALDEGVKLMIVAIPRLNAGEEASASVDFEVTKRRLETPHETEVYKSPKGMTALAKYLNPSPFIESRDKKIVALGGTLRGEAQQSGWRTAEGIFDWVRANVKYEFAEQIKPATAALADGVGDCEELSSLFIALCRVNNIPARAVWVPGHTYPEFYLADEQGRGHWFPCQAAGADRQFGSMIEDRPILQKGDNYTIPGERGPQRYVKQTLTAQDAAAPPEVRFILERVKE